MQGKDTVAAARRPSRDKADTDNVGSVPAPMAGEVIEVTAAPGHFVTAGQVRGNGRKGGTDT